MFACPTQSAGARLAALVAISVLLCPAGRLAADVVTVGVVSPVPPPGGGTSSAQLIVGNGSDDDSNDIWGLVFIDDGTLLQYGSLIVGNNFGYFGEVDVTGNFQAGAITQLNLSSVGSLGSPTVQIGNRGTGWLNVNGGARMTFTNSSGDLSLGTRATGVGYATISDRFTMLTLSDSLYLGQQGIGNLNVLNGALVRFLDSGTSRVISIGVDPGSYGSAVVDGQGTLLRSAANLIVGEAGQGSLAITHGAMVDVGLPNPPLIGGYPSVIIGAEVTSVGSVVVDGTGSRMQLFDTLIVGDEGDPLVVGDEGLGSLTIRNGGYVNIIDKTIDSVYVGPRGRIDLAGGTLAGSSPVLPAYGTTVDGFLGGSGLVRGTVQFNDDSFLEVRFGDLLQFQDSVSNQGAATIDGGEMQFLAGFTNNAQGGFDAPGRISLENSGTVRFAQTLTNDGVLSNAHGATNIHGEISNPGNIVVARDSVATFYDAVTNTGTITVKPGGNALFLTDLSFIGLSILQLGLDTNDLAAGSAQISAGGVMTLGGTLEITFEGGYAPLVGETFELLTAGGGIVGAFDSILLPLMPNNLEVGVHYSPTSVMMEIRTETSSAPLPGDYNQDGMVNAADYTLWRDHLGQSLVLTNQNPSASTPGVVDQEDYNYWVANFGQSFGSGSGGVSQGEAPEPGSLVLLAVGAAAAVACCRMRRSG